MWHTNLEIRSFAFTIEQVLLGGTLVRNPTLQDLAETQTKCAELPSSHARKTAGRVENRGKPGGFRSQVYLKGAPLSGCGPSVDAGNRIIMKVL